MCVKLKGSKMTPGQMMVFIAGLGKGSGVWGFNKGRQYNVRNESIGKIWKPHEYTKGIIRVDSFWEREKEFIRKDKDLFNLGILYNQSAEFAVITVPANEVVKQYHHRMPLWVSDDQIERFFMDQEFSLCSDEIMLRA